VNNSVALTKVRVFSTCFGVPLGSLDIAAGALLIQEAGGKFTDLEGTDFNLQTRKICASNGHIHDELLKVLNDAGIR
jgi:myo-inositol-1(or 4)-monophosphatase